jgi:hypothetical protein
MTATANTEINLNEVDTKTLVKTLQAVLDFTTRTLTHTPDPEYRTSCPLETLLDGNYDDAWEEGQDNGQALEAKHIQDLIRGTLAAK